MLPTDQPFLIKTNQEKTRCKLLYMAEAAEEKEGPRRGVVVALSAAQLDVDEKVWRSVVAPKADDDRVHC
ncbi:hypothetical protein IAQ61_008171 [Plenodomus lingam]|uniref:uncharacterized protein n=1 Tax=Leptosphaeria maculans TaxID=5022 RepID=UPI00331EACD8|nr:hypothetical protein IAQ61_008171 [Plenodomus lingam]